MIIPNTTVRVLRGESVDALGDPIDLDTVVASALPAWIDVKMSRTYDPASGKVTILKGYAILLRTGVFAFSERDRVQDEHTGLTYQVETVETTGGLFASSIRLSCTRSS
jgi:hypothetical protein